MKRDIKDTIEAMDGLPVTIRLLDPPLHEFVPQHQAAQAELAKSLGISRPKRSRSAAKRFTRTTP